MKKQPRHQSERDFIANFFDHDDWEYEPVGFLLSNGEKYYPDFLDKKRGVYIEVAATRQAYYSNKHKYDLFNKDYPAIMFEIRKCTGELFTNGNHRDINEYRNPFVAEIGLRIHTARKKAGYSQAQLAEELNIKQQYISRYENGTKPPYEDLPKISKLLNVSLDHLFGVAEKEVDPDILMASKILTSKSIYSNALSVQIKAFYSLLFGAIHNEKSKNRQWRA